MPMHQPIYHSFDGGKSWLHGRPPVEIERHYPGPIRYRLGDLPPDNLASH
jgi:hypothetical protein